MTAVDTAFHGLRRMISSGQLAAGQRFPPEAELCAELGVSRGSMREAVRMLSALGVVNSRHGSGVFVSQLRPEEIIGSLALTVDLLPLSGLLEMYEVRRVLEAHAASQAAARVTPEIATELESLLEAMEAETNVEVVSELDTRFHNLIASASGNPTLAAFLAVFRSRSRAYQIYGAEDGVDIKRISDESHRQIASGIIGHDPVLAAAAAASHVAQTESWLRRYQPQPVGSDRGPEVQPGA